MAAEWWDVKNWSVNDLFPGAPDFNKQPFGDTEGLGAYIDDYRNNVLQGLTNLTRGQRDMYHTQMLNKGTKQEIDEVINAAEEANQAAGALTGAQEQQDLINERFDAYDADQQALKDKAAENERLGLEGVANARNEYMPQFDAEISKYQGYLADPSKIYSDAELASQLTSVENALAGQLKEAGLTQAKQLSDSGLLASGKLQNRMTGLEQQAGYLKGKNTSDLLGRIQNYLGRGPDEGLQGARKQFDLGLGSAESAYRSGGFADLSGLGNSYANAINSRGNYGLNNLGVQGNLPSLNWGGGNSTGFDITGANLANQNQNVATGLNFFGGLAGNAMQLPSQIMPFFKGFA